MEYQETVSPTDLATIVGEISSISENINKRIGTPVGLIEVSRDKEIFQTQFWTDSTYPGVILGQGHGISYIVIEGSATRIVGVIVPDDSPSGLEDGDIMNNICGSVIDGHHLNYLGEPESKPTVMLGFLKNMFKIGPMRGMSERSKASKNPNFVMQVGVGQKDGLLIDMLTNLLPRQFAYTPSIEEAWQIARDALKQFTR